VLAAIKELREEKMWMDLLGSILTIGNLLNAGNVKKGQADGFDIKNIRSTLTIKGADGSSLLKIICLEHLEKDASFKQFLSKFEKCGQSQRIPIDSLNSRSEHIIQEANSVQNKFKKLKAESDDIMTTVFGKKIDQFLSKEVDSRTELVKSKIKELDTNYEEICDFFMIKRDEEIRKKSNKFFEFFYADFFKKVQEAFPKEKK